MSAAVPARRYADADAVKALVSANVERPAGTAAELDDNVIRARLETAAAQVDAALSGAGRKLPGTPDENGLVAGAPVLVREVATAIAAYLADLTYRETVGHDETAPVRARYEWAQQMLTLWTDGRSLPAGLDPSNDPEQGDITIGDPINPPVPILFGPDMLTDPYPRSYGYDPDWWR